MIVNENKMSMKKLLLILALPTLCIGVCTMNASTQVQETLAIPVIGVAELGHPIKVRYTNYRGETAVRLIVPVRFFWGSNEYHKEEQWLVEVFDVERNAIRIYALKDIKEWFVVEAK